MRLRRSSIRARIIALLLVPIAALSALWIYATLITTGDVWGQLDLSATYKAFGGPADQYVGDLQAERAAAVQRLADPGNKATVDAYQQAQATTDRSLQLLRYQGGSGDAGKLDADQKARFEDMLSVAEQLPAIRSQVGQQRQSWDGTLRDYSDLVQPVFAFRSSFIAKQTGTLPRQGTILVELTRAREYLAQETAAMRALRVGTANDTRKQQVALDAMHSQQALFRIYVGELKPQDQYDYNTLRTNEAWSNLTTAERGFEDAPDRAREARSGPVDPWGENADKVLADISDLNGRLAASIGDQARSYAVNSLLRGGIAGLAGLAAVVLSVIISYRIGRRLVRELVGLRNAATDLSGSRLPSVMLRLRRGEPVDVIAEVPQLEFGAAEIGQVGRAFNEVQRVAVEAAVEQAELRRGVSAVFVNLARRSQVLLHRQLTLLDTMERRTEDPRELEDLFRLDHLTTRMRRHAEGLIILSGGSPGRAWRKPVRMVDVVRAAVGEVEDYARVIVRPFPGTGLLGSAVADVTHLVAELVENATVFSPPQTQVTVQGEVVAHGFCLEIDDRGLGLSEQHLGEINQRLAIEQEFDLADTDRLGLFVVSRLARRHGIRVHLRPSPYGGSSAVVLIPRELLADSSEIAPEAAPRQPVEDATHRRARGGGDEPVRSGPAHGTPIPPAPALGGPRPSLAEPATTPGGLPRRRAAGTPAGDAAAVADGASGGFGPAGAGTDGSGTNGTGTGRHRRTEPGDPTPGSAPEQAAPVAAGLLPRRVRQANLAPQLRGGRADQGAEEPGEQSRERSPEEARSAFASFQRGFARGRGDRLQPASLTVVRSEPSPAGPLAEPPAVRPPALPGQPRLRIALPSAPVPPALPAAPVRSVPPAHQPPAAPPAPAEGTES
ncbi:nitrate- and nitrite sensing domain-containing protein [Kitasatospora sp. NPDC049285]|uniref:sensor histidine kinase n=1 Tax=Kitasatospora sp. NPDC049285 TaxID=3157096 RepID=UPI003427F2CE